MQSVTLAISWNLIAAAEVPNIGFNFDLHSKTYRITINRLNQLSARLAGELHLDDTSVTIPSGLTQLLQPGIRAASNHVKLTLSKYRSLNNKVYFGQNLVHEGEGIINVNDLITVAKRKQSLFLNSAPHDRQS